MKSFNLSLRFGLLALLLSLLCLPAWTVPVKAQTAAHPVAAVHKIVMEVSIDGVPQWEGELRNAKNLQDSFGAENTRIEIVAHSQGIGLLLAKTSAQNPALKSAIEKAHASGIVFAACHNTMKRFKLTPKDLLPIAVIVDSGVAEVVRKQEAGWDYLKVV